MSSSNQPNVDSHEGIADRFGRSVAWAREHATQHRCVDNRLYLGSCLINDPSCEKTARHFLGKLEQIERGESR
jgi:hypothetical protein